MLDDIPNILGKDISIIKKINYISNIILDKIAFLSFWYDLRCNLRIHFLRQPCTRSILGKNWAMAVDDLMHLLLRYLELNQK